MADGNDTGQVDIDKWFKEKAKELEKSTAEMIKYQQTHDPFGTRFKAKRELEQYYKDEQEIYEYLGVQEHLFIERNTHMWSVCDRAFNYYIKNAELVTEEDRFELEFLTGKQIYFVAQLDYWKKLRE